MILMYTNNCICSILVIYSLSVSSPSLPPGNRKKCVCLHDEVGRKLKFQTSVPLLSAHPKFLIHFYSDLVTVRFESASMVST